MSRIFLSHSHVDNRQAIALRQWLIDQDPPLANEIFLDLDRRTGIQAGTKWKEALRQAGTRCEAVICVLSPHWETSTWCEVEYQFAEYLGKRVFCAAIAPLTHEDPTREWQRIDLYGEGPATEVDIGDGEPPVKFLSEGLGRLRDGIVGAGIGAESFVWPPPGDPDRAPYRGWEPLEEVDAAVFFGRDAQIVAGLDGLRQVRRSAAASMFVVLGPSGTGKSSFLRAGLLPRLRREDRNFLILDIVRPQHNVITGETGLAQAICNTRRRLGLSAPSLGEIKHACLTDAARVRELLSEAQRAAGAQLLDRPTELPGPTLVLPLDQAEELIGTDAGAEATIFMQLIADVTDRSADTAAAADSEGGDGNKDSAGENDGEKDGPGSDGDADSGPDRLGLIVAITIRTDRYQALQTAPELTGVATVLFDDLKPMPTTQFKEVIEGPADRATQGGHPLEVESALVNRLLAECTEGGADTLPLLALTLSRLYEYATEGQLTLAHYEAMGGMESVVQREIDELLATAPGQREHQLELLRAAFVPWLATYTEDDQPIRRLARWSDLPEHSRPLIDMFVDKRLMVKDERDGQVVVEVALESLLRQWDQLAGWLREHREDLKAADNLKHNAAAWQAKNRDPEWLLEAGNRLAAAETLASKPVFRQQLAGTHDYLAECRQVENQKLAAKERQRQAELRAAQERQQAAEALAAAEAQAREKAQEHAVELGKSSRRTRAFLRATAVVAVIAIIGLVAAVILFGKERHEKQLADARTRDAVALRLTSQGEAILAGVEGGGDVRAIQQILAAPKVASTADTGAQFTAVVAERDVLKILDSHEPVSSLALSGNRIVSGARDGTMQLWDADTGQPVGDPIAAQADSVNSVAFSPDGRRIVSGSSDGTLRLWDAATRKPIGDPMRNDHGRAVISVAFSPDGRLIVMGGSAGTLRLWDADTRDPVGDPMRGSTDLVYSVAFSPDGRLIVSGSNDGTLQLWNAGTREPVGDPMRGPTSLLTAVYSVAFSPDGHRIVAGRQDHTLQLWNADTRQAVGDPWRGHTGPITSVAFSPDGQRVVSGSNDGTVRLWNTGTGQPIGGPKTGHTSPVFTVMFSADGHRIVSGGYDGTVRVWDADVGQPFGQSPTGQIVDVDAVAFRPDGQRIVSANWDGTLRLWDADGHPVGDPIHADAAPVESVAFSPRGDRIVSGSGDGTLNVWNADTGAPDGSMTVGNRTDAVNAVAFSPDGHHVLCGDSRGTLRLWDVETGQSAGRMTEPDSVNAVAFSPDGHRIVSGSNDGTLQLWNADTQQTIGGPMRGHTDSVNAVAFSPDGHRIVSGSDDTTLQLWNADTRQPVGDPMRGHRAAVEGVAFSPDGTWVLSGSADDTLRLWNAATRQAIGGPMRGHTNGVDGVAFSPHGDRVVSGSMDGTMLLWDTPAPVAWAGLLCKKLTANMSPSQWNLWVSPQIKYVPLCANLPVPKDNPG